MSPPIRVLVVDDSAVARQVISGILNDDPAIEVIATASDPLFAMDKMEREWPDVIVMDVEMPRMDGITFLRKIMAERPTPVVICSSLTGLGAETTMQALEAGAVTIITKPKIGVKSFLEDASADLIGAVKEAARAQVGKLRIHPPNAHQGLSSGRVRPDPAGIGGWPGLRAEPKLNADAMLPPLVQTMGHAMTQTTEKIVAIGTSTGGTQALEAVLTALPRVCPGIVIVQHMPEKFTASFAERLDSLCEIEVREACTNDRVVPGLALIAPGGKHMLLKRSGAQYLVEVVDGPLINRHRPSVDVLFRSVAKFAGKNALGIIMTGMGDDGARGLKEMHDAGASTIAQDEESCVVYGMPKEAVKLGAADRIMPLGALAEAIVALK